jgi:tripartite-type tricarboxylate transporter receptor subunit TctC
MSITPRAASLLALFAIAPWSGASAQNYPTRLVHVIAPYGAGGPSDVFSRIIAQKLSEALKQSFVVENRPGASTMIGTEAVAKAAPDGYTLLIISQTHATNESLVTNKSFQLLRDFVPVAPIYSGDLMLVVHESVPVKTLKEFIALAKAKPGQLNYASSGTGSQYHLAGELFKTMTGTDIVHVPYKGSTGARNDILGGQVQMMFDTVPTRPSRPDWCGRSARRVKRARLYCTTYRPSRKPACPASSLQVGSGSSRRPEHPSRSSIS